MMGSYVSSFYLACRRFLRRSLRRLRYVLLTVLTVLLIIIGLSGPVFSNEPDSAISNYLDRGQSLYENGQYSDAIAPWQQALTLATEQQNPQQQAIAQNYLAIGHQSLGQWAPAQRSLTQGFSALGQAAQTADTQFLYAQLLSTQGNGQLQTGQAEAALETWQQAETIYQALNATEPLLRNQLNQAQALRTLGFYRRAQSLLENTNKTLADLPNTAIKVRGLQSLGQLLSLTGELQQSQTVLETGRAIAQTLQSPLLLAALTADLARTTAALDETERAIALYQEAYDLAQPLGDSASADLSGLASADLSARTLQLDTAIQQFSLLLLTRHQSSPLSLDAEEIRRQLLALPPSRWGIHAQTYFAGLLIDNVIDIGENNTIGNAEFPDDEKGADEIAAEIAPKEIAELLAHAIAQAQLLRDVPSQAAATGQLGHLYEKTQQWAEALTLTHRALTLSQQPQPTYPAAQWAWQEGRLLKAQGQFLQAIEPYRKAVDSLEFIQQDLVALSPDVQFSFRDQVEPVYRDYVELLLTDIDTLPLAQQQTHFQQAIESLESLQLAELQNYFRQTCLTYDTRNIESVDPAAAIIYPILLDQRVEVIAALPGQPLKHYSTPLAASDQQQLFTEARAALHPIRPAAAIEPFGQQLYDAMVRPIAADLVRQDIRTLVFVPDGALRNLPMSILHDGDQYLIERYNVALTPGLQLLNSQPITADSIEVLAAGLSEARQGFRALPGVKQELSQIQELVSTQTLLNDEFTRNKVLNQSQQNPAAVVHLATHGQFSAAATDTFLLTWDDRVNVNDLDQLLTPVGDRTIELLVLSACRTAEGDNRAALGMAGIAVRSGARSTIASLWRVQDNSTATLMTEFYRQLSISNLPRAEALRQAQRSLISDPIYRHPYYWAPFVLIGNWQ